MTKKLKILIIPVIFVFSLLNFSCASKPEAAEKLNDISEITNQDQINEEKFTDSENQINEENININDSFPELEDIEEVEVIDEPIVIDFLPIYEDENQNEESSDTNNSTKADEFLLEEIIEEFEPLLPLEDETQNLQKDNNSQVNSDLTVENIAPENTDLLKDQILSKESQLISNEEQNLADFPIIQVESEEEQKLSESELKVLYESIVPSRRIGIKQGEKILITYPGTNWKFYGITDKTKDIELVERNFINTNTIFEFVAKTSGTKILHFYKFDNLTQTYIDDFIEIDVEKTVEDDVFDVSKDIEENEKQSQSKQTDKKIEAPKYKKIESAKKIGTKKQNQNLKDNKEEKSEKDDSEIKENETKNSTQKIISEKKQIKQIEQNNQTEQKKEIKVIEDNKNQNVEEEVQSLSKSQIEELLTEAQNLYNQKKYKESLEKVKKFLELSNEKRDQALFLQGQLYETQSEVKDIKNALKTYNSIISNYPASKYWEDANKRIIYLNRFYLKGR